MQTIIQRRIAQGAGEDGLNLHIIPLHERADFNAAAMRPDDLVFPVVDIFVTLNGSWEVQPTKPVYGIEQWARDAYLFPPNHPRYNPQGGGDHNSFGLCLDPGRSPYPDAGFIWASDGPQHLQPPTDPNKVVARNGEAPHGWANIPIFNTVPLTGGGEGWSIAKFGAADIVTGIGLPSNWHVSTFVVWQAMTWQAYSGGAPEPEPEPQPTNDLDRLVALAAPMTAGTLSEAAIAERAARVLELLKESSSDR